MTIPVGLYALCEKRRRRRYTAIGAAQERLREARQAAEAVHSAPPDPNGGSHGAGRGDGLERAAIRAVEAEEQLRQALAWDDVFTRMDRIYPEGCLEDTISRLMYDKGYSQAAVCQALGLHRVTVRRYRDTYVINLALLAVQAGLARWMENGEDGRNGQG